MKIGIFTDTYYPNINGVTSSIEREVQALKSHGDDSLLVGPGTYEVGHPIPTWTIYDTRDKRYSLTCPKSLSVAKLLPWRADVVHIHTPFTFGLLGLLCARKVGSKVIYTHHTNFEEYLHYVNPLNNSLGLYLCNLYIRWFCSQTDLVIAPSKKALRILVNIGVPAERVSVLSTPLDDIYLSDQGRATKKKYDVLFVGRLSHEKAIDLLINVYKRLGEQNRGWKLAIVGDGIDREHVLNSLRHLLTTTVVYLGELKKDRLIDVYRASRVLFSPSRSETQGLTLQEAWSQGVPVLAIDCEQTREFVSARYNGWLLPSNAGDIAEALEVLLDSSPAVETHASENCYNSIAKHLPQKWYSQFRFLVGATI